MRLSRRTTEEGRQTGLRGLPLRWRLVVVALAGAVGFAIGFAALATWEVDRLESRALNTALVARLELVRQDIRPDGTINGREPSPRTSLVQVIGPNGAVRDATATLRGQAPLVDLDDVRAAGPHGITQSFTLRHSHLALLAVRLPMQASTAGPAGVGALVVGVDSEGFQVARDQLRFLLGVGIAVLVPLACVLAWLLAGGALRTVTRLTEEAEAVGVSDVGRGLVVPASDPELSRLVAALNRMLDRVATGLEQERRFAADASHRLRTPLATLRAEAELALTDGSPGVMREALEHSINDADNLTDLVNRLLSAHRRSPGEPRPVLDAADEALERWRRQVQAASLEFAGSLAGLAVSTDGQGEESRIDPHVFRAVVDPLVENAVQHTDVGGRVAVALTEADSRLVVDVRDTGHGVAEEVRDRLFRPWTTTREERGGAGLGLWLARESARARGGDVELVDDRPGHTTFRATFPLA